jgi:CubicO group peptidase (beta-lactamase class C family)
MTRLAVLSIAIALAALAARSAAQPAAAATDPTPQTLDDFKKAAERVLTDTGIPGAGIALVRADGIEWAGGIGLADRDAKIPVTGDTHFRAGSISKTFVAMALVQFSLDGEVDLQAPVSELAPDVPIDNPWEATDPVRVIHLLQHTAGFDDMRFNEIFNLDDPADLPLNEALARNPRSRIVRWRPGTRMSYSNHGYALAAYVLEKVASRPYEEVINERIFLPLGMATSSFSLGPADEPLLARSYDDRTGPPLPFTQIYLRPAGNLHTSALELGQFVKLLLNWGETPDLLVVDPEYLGNMEQPRTSLAAAAGLRRGYGTGIVSWQAGGFPLLGHTGGIEGFSSVYGYSPSRDVGFVVLLNGRYSTQARTRLSSLAIRYLKRDVDPPPRPRAVVAADRLRQYEGYYHDDNPRQQAMAFAQWLTSGRTLRVEEGKLVETRWREASEEWIPVSDTLFRLDADVDATRVFTTGENAEPVITAVSMYAVRTPRWRIEIVRLPVLASLAVLLTPLPMLLVWLAHARRAAPAGFWWLKAALLLCAIALLVPIVIYGTTPGRDWGRIGPATVIFSAATVLLPIAAPLALMATVGAWRRGAGRWLRSYALLISLAALVVAAYLGAWDMIGFRPWAY